MVKPRGRSRVTGDTVYVLDLVGYRDGTQKPTLIGKFRWQTDDPAGDPVVRGQWWDWEF
jgi:hypothetical protein